MFCPKCAAQNVDGASFCRVCGANISLVPQALTGQLAKAQPTDDLGLRRGRRRRRDNEPPSLEKGIVNVFIGIGFIVAALAVMWRFPGGVFWGWSLFIPGFSNLGRGVAAIVSARRSQAESLPMPGNVGGYFPNQAAPPMVGSGVPRTGELRTPIPSVTEGTTRHLAAEAPTRHLEE
jgi:hypothetical protein